MCSTRNIRLLISYDGTDFSGWQIQKQNGKKIRTVQGAIEDALEKIHGETVHLTGSGRTDAGVHAAGQVANFYTGIKSMAAERFVPALNSLLPQDVRILAAAVARPDFHARFDARMRTYRYQFICGRPSLPQESRYCLQLWRHPNIMALNDYCRELLGELDCSVFASPHDTSKSRSRYISQAHFFIQGDMLIFEIKANAFLWKMVRSIAGTLLQYEEKGMTTAEFKALIASGDRSLAGPTLPPKGLFLWKIDYYRE
ncbi:MAG: tRNA pseudouridine(38-40) synthase TruA [Treponema sp.]|jgi:tRNA pseudouridine38-40 synthase|nr:tRNA pseudouridine(38-40) synthase TruA [Treponema sp.]